MALGVTAWSEMPPKSEFVGFWGSSGGTINAQNWPVNTVFLMISEVLLGRNAPKVTVNTVIWLVLGATVGSKKHRIGQ